MEYINRCDCTPNLTILKQKYIIGILNYLIPRSNTYDTRISIYKNSKLEGIHLIGLMNLLKEELCIFKENFNQNKRNKILDKLQRKSLEQYILYLCQIYSLYLIPEEIQNTIDIGPTIDNIIGISAFITVPYIMEYLCKYTLKITLISLNYIYDLNKIHQEKLQCKCKFINRIQHKIETLSI
jgi:hypothetical protein